MYRRILLAVDGSEMARRAIPFVVEVARGGDAEVYVLEVVEPLDDVLRQLGGDVAAMGAAERVPLDERAAVLYALQREEASHHLDEAREALQAEGVASVHTVIAEGPAEEIVASGRRLDWDAIAPGARGHSGMEREDLGSVAQAVVTAAAEAAAAVLIVGPQTTGLRGPRVIGMRTVVPSAARAGEG